MGPGAIWRVYATWLPGRRAQLVHHDQTHMAGWRPDTVHWHIQVRRRLPLLLYFWVLAHELAEYVLQVVQPYDGEDRERYANALAAAIVLPKELLAGFLGERLDLELAEVLNVDPACLALRWAELTGQPVAVVSPGRVHQRGDGWGDDTHTRRMARGLALPLLSSGRGVLRHELPKTQEHNEVRVLLVGSMEESHGRRAG